MSHVGRLKKSRADVMSTKKKASILRYRVVLIYWRNEDTKVIRSNVSVVQFLAANIIPDSCQAWHCWQFSRFVLSYKTKQKSLKKENWELIIDYLDWFVADVRWYFQVAFSQFSGQCFDERRAYKKHINSLKTWLFEKWPRK